MAGGQTDIGPLEKLKLDGISTGKGAVQWINNRVKDLVNVTSLLLYSEKFGA